MAKFYRAEVIGSMLRPGFLKEARANWTAGKLANPAFKKIEDRAVDEAIALQEKTGVDVITDGEMRRTHFIAPLTDVISGVKEIPAFTRVWRKPHEKNQQAEETNIQVQYAVVEKIHRQRSLTNEEFTYARSRARLPLKVTLQSADDDAAMVAGIFPRRLSRPVRSVPGRGRHYAAGSARTCRPRMRIYPARCAGTPECCVTRSAAARISPSAGWTRNGC